MVSGKRIIAIFISYALLQLLFYWNFSFFCDMFYSYVYMFFTAGFVSVSVRQIYGKMQF